MSDITKLYVTDGATLGGRSIPQMSTQEILDLLADNGILTSVVYKGTDERYFSVTIFLSTAGRVSGPPRQATSYTEAVKIACQVAIELKWIE